MAKSDKSAGIASDSATGTQAPQTEALAAASRRERYNLLRPSAGIQAPQIAGQAAASAPDWHRPALASPSERYDILLNRLEQLRAMLVMTWGVPGETFRNRHAHDQDAFLWACHDHVEECKDLADSLSERVYGGAPERLQ